MKNDTPLEEQTQPSAKNNAKNSLSNGAEHLRHKTALTTQSETGSISKLSDSLSGEQRMLPLHLNLTHELQCDWISFYRKNRFTHDNEVRDFGIRLHEMIKEIFPDICYPIDSSSQIKFYSEDIFVKINKQGTRIELPGTYWMGDIHDKWQGMIDLYKALHVRFKSNHPDNCYFRVTRVDVRRDVLGRPSDVWFERRNEYITSRKIEHQIFDGYDGVETIYNRTSTFELCVYDKTRELASPSKKLNYRKQEFKDYYESFGVPITRMELRIHKTEKLAWLTNGLIHHSDADYSTLIEHNSSMQRIVDEWAYSFKFKDPSCKHERIRDKKNLEKFNMFVKGSKSYKVKKNSRVDLIPNPYIDEEVFNSATAAAASSFINMKTRNDSSPELNYREMEKIYNKLRAELVKRGMKLPKSQELETDLT